MPFITVDDPSDNRVADYRNIPDADLVQQRGVFVAEGRLVVQRLLLESRLKTRSVLVTEPAREALGHALVQRPDVPVFVVPQSFMDGITGFNIHRGCLAVGERPPAARWQDLVSDPKSQIPNSKVIVVLERVANADNVGGVFRNAAAFGATAVLLDSVSTDPLYRKAIRTSVGAALTMPFARAEPWPAVLDELRDRSIATVALTPSFAAPTLQHVVDTIRGGPVAIVLGHEGEGLTEFAFASCEYQARIPTTPDVDSLNVATAAALALYEIRRAAHV